MVEPTNVPQVPPEGGAEQDTLRLEGVSIKLTSKRILESGDMTFSVWCKKEADDSGDDTTTVQIFDATTETDVEVGEEWVRVIVPMSISSPIAEITITVGEGAAVYFYKAQLEAGTRATDWKPSLEDTDGKISDAQSTADEAQTAISTMQDNINGMLRVDITTGGLHVGRQGKNSEVIIDEDSVDIAFGGQTFSEFGGDYVKFANYEIRETTDGGLAFKLKLNRGE